jgi:phosphoribosylglycinamide formyltransferase-1
MKKIVILASGSGTNAENIIKYFAATEIARVEAVFTNNASAKVLERAKNYGITTAVFSKEELNESKVLRIINAIQPDLIVLAGFLLKFPDNIIAAYPNKIINIHPALLPKYGGKGMYGMHIHRAIVGNKEKETGITVHFVNEHYDEGNILFQKNVILSGDETPEEVAEKIHELEQKYFPEVIEKLLTNSL